MSSGHLTGLAGGLCGPTSVVKHVWTLSCVQWRVDCLAPPVLSCVDTGHYLVDGGLFGPSCFVQSMWTLDTVQWMVGCLAPPVL